MRLAMMISTAIGDGNDYGQRTHNTTVADGGYRLTNSIYGITCR